MIGIIGDVLLDKYDYCSNRENPESSAPCYVVERTEYKPGGAGNVAANVSSLGSKSILVSVIGNDDNARILENILQGMNTHLIRDSKRPTIVKERVMSVQDGRYHFRKDIEKLCGMIPF
jgi:bifunctional ADP-heptose synthase (sugar kinase/adenylyltransferase)